MDFRTGDFGKYEGFIRDTERRYSLPPNLLALTIYQASKYDPAHIAGKGRNPIGVLGIANLTREDCGILWAGADRRLDPLASIVGAARMLRAQRGQFSTWRDALLAYHSDAERLTSHLQARGKLPIRAREYTEQAGAVCKL